MKLIGFVALLIVLFSSLFHVFHADLSNNVLAVALMVLLTILFSDMKEFNFWGLKGVAKEEQKLKSLKGEEAVSTKKIPKVTSAKMQQAVRMDTVVLMDSDRGNFLALSFDIERLMRTIAALLTGSEEPALNYGRVVEILSDHGVLTNAGREQLNAIRWVRNMLIHGREQELSPSTLKDATEIAYDLYMDLRTVLEESQPAPRSKKPSSVSSQE